MMAILFTCLKILGEVLLGILLLFLAVLLLILCVPIRYRLDVCKTEGNEDSVQAKVKIGWLLHLLNIRWVYPQEAFVRVRVMCFTVFRSDKPRKQKIKKERSQERQKQEQKQEQAPEETKTEAKAETKSEVQIKDNTEDKTEHLTDNTTKKQRWKIYLRESIRILHKLRYTIRRIYDKIRDVVENIRYYWNIVRSDLFQDTWKRCSKRAVAILKRIGPYKIKGQILVGMEDPATTGQILAYYGMLYPFLGDKIQVTPDFEKVILKGSLLLKGKITLLHLLKTGFVIYFDRDLRKLLNLLKREDA